MKLWRMRYAMRVTRMNKKRNVYRMLMGKPKVQKPLESSRYKLEKNIKSQLKSGLRQSGLDSSGSRQGHGRDLTDAVRKLWVLTKPESEKIPG